MVGSRFCVKQDSKWLMAPETLLWFFFLCPVFLLLMRLDRPDLWLIKMTAGDWGRFAACVVPQQRRGIKKKRGKDKGGEKIMAEGETRDIIFLKRYVMLLNLHSGFILHISACRKHGVVVYLLPIIWKNVLLKSWFQLFWVFKNHSWASQKW